jgi:hypothetical protein
MADQFGVIPMRPGTLFDEDRLEAIIGDSSRAMEGSTVGGGGTLKFAKGHSHP